MYHRDKRRWTRKNFAFGCCGSRIGLVLATESGSKLNKTVNKYLKSGEFLKLSSMPLRSLYLLTTLISLALAAPPVGADGRAAGPKSAAPETSKLEPGTAEEWKSDRLPSILSAADAARYRVIFRLQEDGEWKAADKTIAKLSDRVLMGHVLSQRYLHPTKYRSRYTELRDWLAKYADHPRARQTYKLALRKKPRNWRAPNRPKRISLAGSGHDGAVRRSRSYNPTKRLSRADRKKLRRTKSRLRWYIRKGWTKAAKNILKTKEVQRLFHPVAYDRERARLGGGYLMAGRTKWALDWAGAAAKRSGKYLPEANWTAGLAAWRLGRYVDAAKYFEAVAKSDFVSPWLISAGGYWAARAYLKARQPQKVNSWFGVASAYPRTFYGLLARKTLGLEVTYNWAPPPLAQEALSELATAPGGRRAVTLLQVGEDARAEAELRKLFAQASPELARAMLALADRANMPSLAMRLGNLLVQSGSSLYDSTAFPVPTLPTEQGKIADHALVLALIRQESGFNPRAKSRAGARGLMQLMPRTASFVARDRRFRRSKRRALFDPETNVALGQRYIDILLKDRQVKGDILRMVAAWNAGPGNIGKMLKELKFGDDPLLFIESIPLRETRIFVERVLTNLWIYRARFDQPTPTLDTLAQGEWPSYRPIRNGPVEVAEDDPARR